MGVLSFGFNRQCKFDQAANCFRATLGVQRQLQSLAGQEHGLTTPLGDMRIRRKMAFNFAAGRVNSGVLPDWLEKLGMSEVRRALCRERN